MDLFKGEMAFVREYSGVTKSTGGIEFTGEAKAIPCLKGRTVLLQKEKERTLYSEVTVRKDNLFGLDQKLSAFLGAMRDTGNHPFQGDSIETDESGNMRRRLVWMKIEMDRENSESQEKEGGHPGAPSRFFQDLQEDPETEEEKKRRDQIGREIGEIKMSEINS